jgi:2-deoxy-D-gluconate 3-dehydrogenase
MLNAFDLSGRVALVTGANTGLGQGLAVGLAGAGADIVAAGRSAPDATRAVVEALGRRFAFVSADLGDVSQTGRVAAEAEKAIGPVDILVNNAGTILRNDALAFTEAEWDQVMNVNLKSVFFLSQAVARGMVARGKGGKIIHIASMLSFQGGIRVASYTASKSGLAGLTRLMANEWASHGINVNAIAPGYFATNNTEALRADDTRNAQILARIPAGRWGEPTDLAGAAVFLASRASDYMHGAIVPVDGGWLGR